MGNLSVMGIVSQQAVIPQEIPDEEKDAQRLLFEEAISYIDRWNKAEEELAFLMHLAVARPIPTIVTIGGIIDVGYLLDIPHDFEWKGVYVDADLRIIEQSQLERSVNPAESGATSNEQPATRLTSCSFHPFRAPF